jgi:hypothetical protein
MHSARQTCEYGDAGYKYLVTFVTRTQNTESTIVQNLPFMFLLSFSSANAGSIGEVDRDSFAVGFRVGTSTCFAKCMNEMYIYRTEQQRDWVLSFKNHFDLRFRQSLCLHSIPRPVGGGGGLGVAVRDETIVLTRGALFDGPNGVNGSETRALVVNCPMGACATHSLECGWVSGNEKALVRLCAPVAHT